MRPGSFADEIDEQGERRLDLALRAALASLGLRLAGEDLPPRPAVAAAEPER